MGIPAIQERGAEALDPPALSAYAERGLAWLHDHRASFRPPPTSGAGGFARKMLLEIGLTCTVLWRLGDWRDHPHLRALIGLLEAECARPVFRHRIVRQPERVRLHGLTALLLLECGVEDPELAELVRKALRLGHTRRIEQVPYRALELAWMADLCEAWPPDEIQAVRRSAYDASLVRDARGTPHFRDSDVYAVTHAAFFATDFGRRDPADVFGGAAPGAAELSGILLGASARQENWDLTAELLMTRLYLGAAPGLVEQAAWAGLLRTQRDDGSAVGPHFSAESMSESDDPETYFVEQNYHTTMVGVAAAATTAAHHAAR